MLEALFAPAVPDILILPAAMGFMAHTSHASAPPSFYAAPSVVHDGFAFPSVLKEGSSPKVRQVDAAVLWFLPLASGGAHPCLRAVPPEEALAATFVAQGAPPPFEVRAPAGAVGPFRSQAEKASPATQASPLAIRSNFVCLVLA